MTLYPENMAFKTVSVYSCLVRRWIMFRNFWEELNQAMWYQAFSLQSTSGPHLGILSFYIFKVQWYLGWGRGQKLNHKVTKWDKELSPWDAVDVKHNPTALNTNSPPCRITAHTQIPGTRASQEIHSWLCKQPAKVQRTCASRNDSQEQDPGTFREKTQPQTDWADGNGPWRKENAGTAHPTLLQSWHGTEGLKIWPPAEGGK